MNAIAERLPPFMRRMDPAVVTAFACILLLLFVLLLAVSIGAFGLFRIRNRLDWFG